MQKGIIIFVSLSILLSIIVSIVINPPKAILSGGNMASIGNSIKVPETKTEKAVTTSLKEKVSFNNIFIQPFVITEDSRCPSDVQCIQAGRVVVALNIYSLEGELILSKDIEEGTFFDIGNTKITLVKVSPYPVSTDEIEEGDYRFDFIFEVIE
jgi:hypothetical protein